MCYYTFGCHLFLIGVTRGPGAQLSRYWVKGKNTAHHTHAHMHARMHVSFQPELFGCSTDTREMGKILTESRVLTWNFVALCVAHKHEYSVRSCFHV